MWEHIHVCACVRVRVRVQVGGWEQAQGCTIRAASARSVAMLATTPHYTAKW